jgi:hypothetical protein
MVRQATFVIDGHTVRISTGKRDLSNVSTIGTDLNNGGFLVHLIDYEIEMTKKPLTSKDGAFS